MFKNKPAFGIYANNQQIGHIPFKKFDWYNENKSRLHSIAKLVVCGGNDVKKNNYGVFITLQLNKQPKS